MPLLAIDTEAVQQYVARRTSKTSASRSRVLRASVRIFLDTDERGQFRRRVGSPPTTPAWFAPILTPYLLFVQTHRGLAAKTVRQYTQKLSAFRPAHWRAAPASGNSTGLREGDFRQSFTENAGNNAPRRSYGSTLRVFFRWAAAQGWLSSSLRDAVPRPRQYRYVNLPDVAFGSDRGGSRPLSPWTDQRLLEQRESSAVLYGPAARYGLRPCDIRQLTLDEIRFSVRRRIDLRQVETGRPLVLPLLPEVAGCSQRLLARKRPPSVGVLVSASTVNNFNR